MLHVCDNLADFHTSCFLFKSFSSFPYLSRRAEISPCISKQDKITPNKGTCCIGTDSLIPWDNYKSGKPLSLHSVSDQRQGERWNSVRSSNEFSSERSIWQTDVQLSQLVPSVQPPQIPPPQISPPQIPPPQIPPPQIPPPQIPPPQVQQVAGDVLPPGAHSL